MHTIVNHNNQSVSIDNTGLDLIETNNNHFRATDYVKKNCCSFFGCAIVLTGVGWFIGHLTGVLIYSETHPKLNTPNGNIITTNEEKIYQAVGEVIGSTVCATGASFGRLAYYKLKERCCYPVRTTNNIENTSSIASNSDTTYV
jgi:hypothetical protein